jgi:ubiquinone/menaquinone biosynthesis C-methylase UbiE
MNSSRTFLPAAGRDLFLPAYDPIMRILGFQRLLRTLVDQAGLRPNHVVLDIGCGTGTLAVLIKRLHPSVHVIGIDPDPKALARARRKAKNAAVRVTFGRAFGDALPHADRTFDGVFSSMMFHHLQKDDKPRVLSEIRRVLAAGGRLQLLDFAGGGPPSMLARLMHGRHMRPAAMDRLVIRMQEAGFADAARVAERQTLFGPVAFYQASAVT